jgi:hypothetical protein
VRAGRKLAASGLGLVVVMGVAAWARPVIPDEPTDPALALATTSAVPAHVTATLRRACFDCHSNETRWPWYARLPGAIHLMAHDVREGRAQLDWSVWAAYNRFDRAELLDKACERASQRLMPPWQYRMLHPEARLSSPEVDELCVWSRREAARLAQGGS